MITVRCINNGTAQALLYGRFVHRVAGVPVDFAVTQIDGKPPAVTHVDSGLYMCFIDASALVMLGAQEAGVQALRALLAQYDEVNVLNIMRKTPKCPRP